MKIKLTKVEIVALILTIANIEIISTAALIVLLASFLGRFATAVVEHGNFR